MYVQSVGKNNNSPSTLWLRVQLHLVLIVSAPFACLGPLQLASGSFSLILASSRRGLHNTPRLASLVASQLRRYLPTHHSASFPSFFYFQLRCCHQFLSVLGLLKPLVYLFVFVCSRLRVTSSLPTFTFGSLSF